MREVGNKFVLTDYERATRIVQVVKKLDFVKEVFVIGDKPVEGCTPFNKLLQDSGDGKITFEKIIFLVVIGWVNLYFLDSTLSYIRYFFYIEEHFDNKNDVDLNSTAWLAYSSGTTGLAKCIVHTHRSIVGSFSSRK